MSSLLDLPPRARLGNFPTPFYCLERLSEMWGGPRIWIKRDDLTGLDLTGNKIRKLEFSLGAALQRKADTLITCGALQSNHCRTTAAAGARLGLKVHLVLLGEDQECPDGNMFLNRLYGAEITFLKSDDFSALLSAVAEVEQRYIAQSRRPYVIPLGLEASDELGLWGYISACSELQADLEQHNLVRPHLVTAIGTGSTLGGLAIGNVEHGLGMTLWGVNTLADAAFFERKISQTVDGWRAMNPDWVKAETIDFNVLDGYVGPGYGQATAETWKTIQMAAACEGVALDPVYSGKALTALRSEIRRGRFGKGDEVVFLHTGSVFSLMAQRQQFLGAARG